VSFCLQIEKHYIHYRKNKYYFKPILILAKQLIIMTSRKLSLDEVLELLHNDEEFFDDEQEIIQEGSDDEFEAEEVDDSDLEEVVDSDREMVEDSGSEESEDLENGNFNALQEFQQGIS